MSEHKFPTEVIDLPSRGKVYSKDSPLKDGKIELKYKKFSLDKTDGLKISWENSWVHIRKSNTEPIIRIYSEAQSINEAENIVKKIRSII